MEEGDACSYLGVKLIAFLDVPLDLQNSPRLL